MCIMSRGDLLLRRRSKKVETDTVSRNSSQQPAFRRRPVNSRVLFRLLRRWVDRLPTRLPERIDVTVLVGNQFANVSATFQSRNVSPWTLEAKARPSIHNV